jgi:hypothetical protein
MSKTPFEIRLELLKLAKETLYEPIYAKRESMISEYHSSRETYPGEAGPRNPMAFPTLPEFPDTSTVINEAEKLKGFIDGN